MRVNDGLREHELCSLQSCAISWHIVAVCDSLQCRFFQVDLDMRIRHFSIWQWGRSSKNWGYRTKIQKSSFAGICQRILGSETTLEHSFSRWIPSWAHWGHWEIFLKSKCEATNLILSIFDFSKSRSSECQIRHIFHTLNGMFEAPIQILLHLIWGCDFVFQVMGK